VPSNKNTELKDFKMLVKLLKSNEANATFIISPLNPYYYRDLQELDPVVSEIEAEIRKQDFKYLNLFTSDSTKYDKAILSDVMHMSEYGWLLVNKFIADTYKLEK
jgi:D-alanine transfer protein